MKTALILFVLIISSSYALGETYRWEDADTMYFTDNPESIPEQYREKVLEMSREERQTPKSVERVSPPQNINQTIHEQASVARAVAIPAQIPTFPLIHTYAKKNIREDFEPLSKLMAVAIVLSAVLSIGWILILADIIRSEFTISYGKAQWIVLVVMMAPLGMLLYLIIGLGQKKRSFHFQGQKELNHV